MTVREVLVTGATGFVGTHVAEALTQRVPRVRAIVRSTSDTTRLRELGVEPVVVSLEDERGLESAVSGADVIIHLAALTHAKTEAALQRVNGGGTEALVAAALNATVQPRRFVYLSSLAAVGPSSGRRLGSNDVPAPLTAYGRSKLAGEAALAKRADSIEAVILRAPAVYGPGDREMLRFFRLAKTGLMPLPAGAERPLQLVHVKDLARGIAMAALHEGVTGTYNIAEDRAYGWREVCRLIGESVGRTPVFVPVPHTAMLAAASASELFSKLLGQSTMFNRDKVREVLAPGWLCETDTAKNAFGFAAEIPLAEGMQGTAAWYRTKGWL